MARKRWIASTNEKGEFELIDISEYDYEPSPRVHVIQDTMDATRHPINGRMYESKSEFRKLTKAAGCVEVGNDPLPRGERRGPPPGLKDELLRAYDASTRRR